MNKQKTDWQRGCEHARDYILFMIVGMSNEYNCIPGSEKDKAYMEVYKEIIDRCGDVFGDWKL